MLQIEGVGTHTFGDWADLRFGDDVGHMAILAVFAAHGVCIRYDRGPERGGGALRDGLPDARRFAVDDEIRVDRVDHLLNLVVADVTSEFRLDAAGMHGGGADSAGFVPVIQSHSDRILAVFERP